MMSETKKEKSFLEGTKMGELKYPTLEEAKYKLYETADIGYQFKIDDGGVCDIFGEFICSYLVPVHFICDEDNRNWSLVLKGRAMNGAEKLINISLYFLDKKTSSLPIKILLREGIEIDIDKHKELITYLRSCKPKKIIKIENWQSNFCHSSVYYKKILDIKNQ